jgi:hypothetical protein
MKPGDWFQVVRKDHFAFGQRHLCTGLPRIKIRGHDACMDFGKMIEFKIEDYYGKPCKHVIPIEWCAPCERPSVARRVK